MSKPNICWTPTPSDGIYDVFRDSMVERGYPRGGLGSPIIAFSAGEPFWSDPGHDPSVLSAVLDNRNQTVVICERHEFGWPNYADPAQRASNAWLGVLGYGTRTEVAHGIHGFRHAKFGEFVRNLVANERRLIYLRREYFADYPYPTFVHPSNFRVSSEPAIPSFNEWSARPHDVVCAWAVTNPFRDVIGKALHKAVDRGWFKGEIRSPATRGTAQRVAEGEDYRKFHESGRIFLEVDGHGLGGGRAWELVTTLAMARKRSHMRIRDDWRHGWSCLEFGTPDEAREDEMIDVLCDAIRRPRDLYEIFRAGYENAKKHTWSGQADYLEALLRRCGAID